MKSFVAAVAGLLFGAGLLVSGMTQPAKVIGFLDVTGTWDPSLAFVMAGAVLVNALTFWTVARRRATPWLDTTFHLPTHRDVDLPLVAGSALFGVGWGLGGFCPGPGLVSAAAGSTAGLTFAGAMLAGMLLQRFTSRAPGMRDTMAPLTSCRDRDGGGAEQQADVEEDSETDQAEDPVEGSSDGQRRSPGA